MGAGSSRFTPRFTITGVRCGKFSWLSGTTGMGTSSSSSSTDAFSTEFMKKVGALAGGGGAGEAEAGVRGAGARATSAARFARFASSVGGLHPPFPHGPGGVSPLSKKRKSMRHTNEAMTKPTMMSLVRRCIGI